jgi:hypothetical protein
VSAGSPDHRRRPENTDLFRAVRRHLLEFSMCSTGPESTGLPVRVRQEIERYLRCGIRQVALSGPLLNPERSGEIGNLGWNVVALAPYHDQAFISSKGSE